MSFENNNFQVVRKTRLPKGELNLAVQVAAGDEIAKVYAVSLNVYCDNQEITDGVVSYSGHVDVCMIYGLEDGGIASAQASHPFSSKFEDEQIANGEKAIIELKVVDHEIGAISGSEATINVTVEQSGALIQNVEVRNIKSSDDSICVKEDELKIVQFVGSGISALNEKLQTSSREKVKKVLGTEASVTIKNVEAGVNFVSVSGDVNAKVLYVDDNDRFQSADLHDSFKEEIEIEGVNRENFVEAFARVNASDIKVEIEDEDSSSKISLNVPFEVAAYAFEEKSVTLVSDLFSTKNEVEITSETFNMSRSIFMENIEGKADGSLTIDQDQPRVDKIMFTFGSGAVVTNSYVADGELTLEGIAKTTVVYLNDELGSLNAVEIEVPFVLSDKTKASSQALILTNAVLTDVDVAVKKGRELFFDGKVKVNVIISEDEVSATISEVTEGETLAEKDYAMELVFAKEGDTLWDIAKMSKVKERMIAEQNPSLVFPLQENNDIVIFYQNV